MESSQLVFFLGCFDDKQLQEFELFLRSPYLNRGSNAADALTLFGIIRAFLKQTDSAKVLDKNIVEEQVFEGRQKVKGKLDKLMSVLLGLAYNFISLEYAKEKHDFDTQLRAVRFFRERNVEKKFEQEINNLQRNAVRNASQNEEWLYEDYLIQNENFLFYDYHDAIKSREALAGLTERLDTFYIIKKLELMLRWQHLSKFLAAETTSSITLFNDTYPHFLTDQVRALPITQVYLAALEVVSSHQAPNDAAYERFTQLLDEYREKLPSKIFKDLLFYQRSYCTHQYNLGRTEFLETLYELTKSHLETGYLFIDDSLKLTPSQYSSIALLAINSQHFNWVREFLDSFRYRIIMQGNDSEDVYNLNLAEYFRVIGQFDKALEHLNFGYKEISYQVQARRMELKILYDSNSDILDHKIEAFKVYIHRLSGKILSENRKIVNNNFIDILRQIIHPSTYNNARRIQRILQNLEDKKAVSERAWLREKLNALGG